MVDRAVEREGSFAGRACEDGTVPVGDQRGHADHYSGKAGSMVGDFPARRCAGAIARGGLCFGERFRLSEVWLRMLQGKVNAYVQGAIISIFIHRFTISCGI